MSALIDFPVPERPVHRPGAHRPPTSPAALIGQAWADLAEARRETDPNQRFAVAYLAALRGAAAMLALRGRPHRGRARPTSAWVLLAGLAPELDEWALFFASSSATRAAVQAGVTRLVTQRAADDMTRQTAQFLDLIATAITTASTTPTPVAAKRGKPARITPTPAAGKRGKPACTTPTPVAAKRGKLARITPAPVAGKPGKSASTTPTPMAPEPGKPACITPAPTPAKPKSGKPARTPAPAAAKPKPKSGRSARPATGTATVTAAATAQPKPAPHAATAPAHTPAHTPAQPKATRPPHGSVRP